MSTTLSFSFIFYLLDIPRRLSSLWYDTFCIHLLKVLLTWKL